jgi:hypothetical protein
MNLRRFRRLLNFAQANDLFIESAALWRNRLRFIVTWQA